MTLLDITIEFENKKEQDFAEDFLSRKYSVFPWCREEGKWTEFDIYNLKPDYVSKMLNNLTDNMTIVDDIKMTLLDITIGFENKKEQDFAEDFLKSEYSIFPSCEDEGEWTEFDISDCEPADVSKMLDDLMDFNYFV